MAVFYRIKQLILLVGDLVCFYLALWLALTVRVLETPTFMTVAHHLPLFTITFLFWLVVNYINGLYDLKQKIDSRRLIETGSMSLIGSVIFFYILPSPIAPKTILLLTIVIGYTLSVLWRQLYKYSGHEQHLQTSVVFVGFNNEVKELLTILANQPERGYHPRAIVDMPERLTEVSADHIRIYHNLDEVKNTHKHGSEILVIAPHIHHHPTFVKSLYSLLFSDTHITNLTSFYEQITGRIPPATFSESWFIEHFHDIHTPVYYHIRRFGDWLAALIIGVFFVVLFPLITLAIKTTSKGPLFIKQTRVGRYGNIFIIYKFRSMYALSPDGSAEVNGYQFAQKKDSRITPVGKWLRRLRLDELPQVWNLIRGDLTLVGPRPERPEIVAELQKLVHYYPLRHIVTPGLTSWAMIHQDYTDTIETTLQKFEYDLYYIKNHSLLLDISILLKTIEKIVRLKGQ